MAKTEGARRAAYGGKGGFYRLMRDLHGWFSAVAFMALILFAATGILLNHPGLLVGKAKPLHEVTISLSAEELARVKAAKDPPKELAAIVGGKTKLQGAFANGDLAGSEIYVMLESVKGNSNLHGNLDNGRVEVTVDHLRAVEVLNALHRGELAGKAWKFWIDVMGALILIMAIVGYILFFSLRFRVKTAVALTVVSLAAMIGLYVALVP